MKKPQFSKTSKPADSAVEEVEILPQDGLTVIETVEEVVEEPSLPEDPLPSVPVDEPVIETKAVPNDGAMHYLGTFAMPGMVGKGGSSRVSAMPVVAKTSDGRILGVLVVGDPGDVSPALSQMLEGAGHAGAPFTLVNAITLDRQTKLAAARAIAAQTDANLDRSGALMALGFTASQLA
jgi:hypothetical protein